MRLAVDSDSDSEGEGTLAQAVDCRSPSLLRRKRVLVEKHKLIIIMVGLPGRGKTFLCNKLKSYLTWLGHPTRHFNVGIYRRKNREDGVVQDASFFDSHNAAGMEARQKALNLAIHDMLAWLEDDAAQVAIFDATNSTFEASARRRPRCVHGVPGAPLQSGRRPVRPGPQRREYLRSFFHGKIPYMFIESMCSDVEVLEQNYRYKML